MPLKSHVLRGSKFERISENFTGVYIDIKPAVEALLMLEKEMQAHVEAGMKEAALALLDYTNTEFPKPPVQDPPGGPHLRNSGSAFVNGELVGTSEGAYPGDGTPLLSLPGPMLGQKGEVVATVIFQRPYAHRWHETEPRDWTTRRDTPFHDKESGTKYLEAKGITHGAEFKGMVEDAIRSVR